MTRAQAFHAVENCRKAFAQLGKVADAGKTESCIDNLEHEMLVAYVHLGNVKTYIKNFREKLDAEQLNKSPDK